MHPSRPINLGRVERAVASTPRCRAVRRLLKVVSRPITFELAVGAGGKVQNSSVPRLIPPEARLAVGRGPRALGGATMPVLLYPFTHKTWTTMERFEDAAADRAMLLLWELEAQLL